MTKWLCHLSAQTHRAPGPFTTDWYNEDVIVDGQKRRQAVSAVSPNSIIVEPAHEQIVVGPFIQLRGWAWSCDGIKEIHLSVDAGASWQRAQVETRSEFEWQAFAGTIELRGAETLIMARAVGINGAYQPLDGARNCVHGVNVIRRSG
jgi:hypothetical protein